MKIKNIKIKSFEQVEEIDKIPLLVPYVGARDNYDEFAIYKAIAYTNKQDRDGEIASIEFIEQLAEKIIGVPVIKDHNWDDVSCSVGRVVSSEVIDFEDTYKAVKIMFYASIDDDKKRLNDGLYTGISVGFNASEIKENDDVILTGCEDVYEVSLVNVPSVKDAHIIKSAKGDIEMQENENLKQELDTVKSELEACKSENETLRAENDELKSTLLKYEEDTFKSEATDALEAECEKAADEMDPNDEKVKGFIVEELKSVGFEQVENGEGAIALKCGKFCKFVGLADKVNSVRTKYSDLGLLGKKEVVETKSASTKISFTNSVKTKSADNTVVKNPKCTVTFG